MSRATEEDLAALEKITERILKAHEEKDYDTLVENDFEFHLSICKASKSRYFPMLYEVIGGVLRKQMWLFGVYTNKHRDAQSRLVDDHVKILQALKEKDFDTFLLVLTEHMNYETHKD